MSKTAGNLPSQPLFYVLASIRFEPWMLLPSKIPEIQHVLREEFPVSNQVVFEQRTMALPTLGDAVKEETVKREAWSFMAADRSIGCQLASDQIIVHGRKYSEFPKFAETVSHVLKVVQSHCKHFDVNAIGLRYLDLVAPKDGEDLSMYMAPGFLPEPMKSPNFKTLGGLSQSTYETSSGVLRAQFWSGNGFVSVPDDLVPLYVLTQDLKPGEFPIRPLPPGHGTLDSDCIYPVAPPAKMDAEQIVQRLDELHSHIGAFFHIACLPHAFEVWREKK